jgi:hypothetical protein
LYHVGIRQFFSRKTFKKLNFSPKGGPIYQTYQYLVAKEMLSGTWAEKGSIFLKTDYGIAIIQHFKPNF